MRLRLPVMLDDVLASLVGDTPHIPSTMGAQLEIMRSRAVTRSVGEANAEHVTQAHDPWRAIDQAELNACRDVGVIRCLDDLCKVERVSTRWIPALNALHKRVGGMQGALAVGVMRAYSEWALRSRERGWAEVYAFAERLLGRSARAESVAEDFRTGTGLSADARKRSVRLQVDSFEVISEWVRLWNKRNPASWRNEHE